MLPLVPMSDIRKYLWVGQLFITIPFLAFVLHITTFGGMGSNSALVYLPFWLGAQQSLVGMILGIFVTLAIWFAIGLLAVKIALKVSADKFRISVWILFGLTFLVAVILPWLPEFQYHSRIFGIGYTLDDCRKIDPTLHDGNDRRRCIDSTVIRMVNENDPAVNEEFCNSIIEDEDSMRYCWLDLAYEKGTTVDFCKTATLPAVRQSCIFTIATKLDDISMCQYITDSQYRTSCITRTLERVP